MSLLSASGLLTPAQADEYTAALLQLLGSRDPLDVLAEMPEKLRDALDRIPASGVGTPEAPGRWSTRIEFAHLADSELVGAFRLRMILAHERPTIAAYDQDRWASSLQYESSDERESLERFSALRRANLALWTRATLEQWARVGVHAERAKRASSGCAGCTQVTTSLICGSSNAFASRSAPNVLRSRKRRCAEYRSSF